MRAVLGDRSLFPDLQAKAYLNHAAISPPSLPVRAAVQDVVDDYARRGAHAWLRFRDQRDELRARLAQLVNCAPADIALVPNTSHGVLDVALCYPWRRGDRVVLMRGDFPANVTPWQRAAATFGLEIEPVPSDADRATAWPEHLHLIVGPVSAGEERVRAWRGEELRVERPE